MALDTLVNQLRDKNRMMIDKFDHLYYSSLAFITIKGLDVLSTSLNLHKYNDLIVEGNPIANYSIEQFGIDAGLLIFTVPLVTITLGTAYMINKISKPTDSIISKNLGPILLYGSTLITAPFVINNFAIYFNN